MTRMAKGNRISLLFATNETLIGPRGRDVVVGQCVGKDSYCGR